MKFSKYKKNLDYSYTLGACPTIELLKNRKDNVIRVIYNSKAKGTESFKTISNLCGNIGVALIEADNQVNQLSDKENVYFVGIFEKYESVLNDLADHLVLYNPSDFGNLGTIIRTCLGFNIHNLVLIDPAADIFNPKTIRSSMGSIFNINFKYVTDLEKYIKNRNNIYIFDGRGEQNLETTEFKSPSTIVFGAEAAGVPDEILPLGTVIKIPQSSKIDSLNLAVSVGIGLYEFRNKK